MSVKLRMNLCRPRHKAKYYLATDSEPVPRGKGEKYRCERSEIVPETVCAYNECQEARQGVDRVPIEE